MTPALMEHPFIHEGFSVLEAVLKRRFYNVRASLKVEETMCHIILDVTGTLPSKALLSRLVVVTLNLDSYTLHLRTISCEDSSSRMSNLIRGVRESTSGTPMSHPLYVVSGLTGDRKSPLGTFSTRPKAEDAVTSGLLQRRLGASDLRVFDNLVVEKWGVQDLNSEGFAKRLTLYTVEGSLLLSLPEETSKPPGTLGRLSSILSSSLDS